MKHISEKIYKCVRPIYLQTDKTPYGRIMQDIPHLLDIKTKGKRIQDTDRIQMNHRNTQNIKLWDILIIKLYHVNICNGFTTS